MIDVARAIVQFEARTLVDEDGRPVAEIASPLYADTPTEIVACPYADRRRGQPMNRSALRQLTGVWPEVLAGFSAIAGPAPTVHRAWVAAITGIAAPLVAPAPISRAVSSMFKASLGFSQVFSSMLLSDPDVADTPLTALGDADGFFQALDAGGWLIGAEQVCAGSAQMFHQAFETWTGRTPIVGDPSRFIALAAQLGPTPVEAVALHVAWLAARQRAARGGRGTAPSTDVAPWLRAVFATPDRPPEHARRLFPVGETPAVVERLLGLTGASPEALDAAFADGLAEAERRRRGRRRSGRGRERRVRRRHRALPDLTTGDRTDRARTGRRSSPSARLRGAHRRAMHLAVRCRRAAIVRRVRRMSRSHLRDGARVSCGLNPLVDRARGDRRGATWSGPRAAPVRFVDAVPGGSPKVPRHVVIVDSANPQLPHLAQLPITCVRARGGGRCRTASGTAGTSTRASARPTRTSPTASPTPRPGGPCAGCAAPTQSSRGDWRLAR